MINLSKHDDLLRPTDHGLFVPRDYQFDALSNIHDLYTNHAINRFLVFLATGLGKAQPHSEPVLTPNGFVPMGAVSVGDTVYDQDGIPTRVKQVYPQGEKRIYKVYFNDGSVVRTTKDHLWTVRTKYDAHRTRKDGRPRWRTLTSAEMTGDESKWQVPNVKPVQHSEKDLPIDPYVYGVLLAECARSVDSVVFSCGDSEIVERVDHRLTKGFCVSSRSNGTAWGIVRDGSKGSFISRLKDVGLYMKGSHERHIDARYLIASVEQRVDLLRGIMDGDGTVSDGIARYSSASEELSHDVARLVRSLGARTKVYQNKATLNGERHRDRFRLTININTNPFYLERKRDLYNANASQGRSLVIRKVVKTNTFEKAQCIEVESDTSTYVTTDYKVTHNSSGVMMHLPRLFPYHVLDHGMLFMAHRRKILMQAYRKFKSAYPNLYVGLEMGEEKATGYEDVVFMSVESVGREYQTRIEKYQHRDFGVVVADEGHHVKEDSTWDNILTYFGVGSDPAYHRTIDVQGEQVKPVSVFLTATPKGDTLAPFLDEVAAEMSIVDGIREGWLTDIKAHRAIDSDGVTDTDQGEIDFLVQVYRKFLQGHRTLGFARSVDQSERLAHNVQDHGLARSAHIDASTEKEERRRIYRDFEAKDGIDFLCNRLVLVEGFDNPNITAILDNAPTESTSLHIQKLGRGLRPHRTARVDDYQTPEERRKAILQSEKPHLLYVATFDPTTHGLDIVAELTESENKMDPEGSFVVSEVIDVLEEFEEDMPDFDVSQYESIREIKVALQQANVFTQTIYNEDVKALTPLAWVVEGDKAALYLPENPFTSKRQYRNAECIVEFEQTDSGIMKRVTGGGWNGTFPVANKTAEIGPINAEDLHECIAKQDQWLKQKHENLYNDTKRGGSMPARKDQRNYLKRKGVNLKDGATEETADILIMREKIKNKRKDQ